MTAVGVVGARGRMGSASCAAVEAAEDLRLVASVDLDDPLETLVEAGAEVVVDFTVPAVIREHLDWYAAHGLRAVVGTTGLSAGDLAAVADAYAEAGLGCLVAPNFAIGAVLMMRFAELAAPWFETAEIVELHHDNKVDAPSGTALLTAERMAAASSEWATDPTRTTIAEGARGGVVGDAIHVHSVRLRGMVAHQEVLLGTTGQTLTVRHDSYDRASFMPGVLAGVRYVVDHTGLTVGLEAVLGL